jgi:hypothetical protein
LKPLRAPAVVAQPATTSTKTAIAAVKGLGRKVRGFM